MAIKPVQHSIPVLDFSAFDCGHSVERAALINSIKKACESRGFFQIINHGIPNDLQDRIMQASRDFFALPLAEKLKCDKSKTKPSRRGYEVLGAQMLEPGTKPEHKESFYLGEDFPSDHPRVVAGAYNCGPNIYPEILGDGWKDVTMSYFESACAVGMKIMRALALGLGVSKDWFDPFLSEPSSILRLLHYPSTPRGGDKERGVGAHRDFGCITLLLQDDTGGLQVQDEETGEWIDVNPVPGALVVNLGNLMARWTNGHYTSNTPCVLNFADQDRTSIVLFFNGNAEHVVTVVPGCEDRPQRPIRKYGLPAGSTAPVKVRDFLNEQNLASYNRVREYEATA